MTTLFIILFATPQLGHFTCTPKQLAQASQVFKPCMGEKHFMKCYEASIFEYCEVKLWK